MKMAASGRTDRRSLAVPPHDRADRGQVLALFTLALVAIVAMVGLVIDGGDAFLQRRQMQNVADAAAMAAGYSFAMTGNEATAEGDGVDKPRSRARPKSSASWKNWVTFRSRNQTCVTRESGCDSVSSRTPVLRRSDYATGM